MNDAGLIYGMMLAFMGGCVVGAVGLFAVQVMTGVFGG